MGRHGSLERDEWGRWIEQRAGERCRASPAARAALLCFASSRALLKDKRVSTLRAAIADAGASALSFNAEAIELRCSGAECQQRPLVQARRIADVGAGAGVLPDQDIPNRALTQRQITDVHVRSRARISK